MGVGSTLKYMEGPCTARVCGMARDARIGAPTSARLRTKAKISIDFVCVSPLVLSVYYKVILMIKVF